MPAVRSTACGGGSSRSRPANTAGARRLDQHRLRCPSSTRSWDSRPFPNFKSTPAACWSWLIATRRAGPGASTNGSIPGSSPARRPPSRRPGPPGRDVGVAAWGAPFGGHMKYYLGAYQLQDPALSPLFSGRVQVEPALARAGLVSAHDVLRRPRSRLHRHRRPDPEQRFGHGPAAGDGGCDPTAGLARRLSRVQRRSHRREAVRRPRRAVPRGRVLQLPAGPTSPGSGRWSRRLRTTRRS